MLNGTLEQEQMSNMGRFSGPIIPVALASWPPADSTGAGLAQAPFGHLH